MNRFALLLGWLLLRVIAVTAAPQPLFDGSTFHGWEGATGSVWRVRDGVVVGGSLQGNPRNEFLATTRSYTNFVLRLEYKLVGTEGFINGGVQFRSRRIPNPPNEMSGFQADIGAGYSGSLYDESRRNRMLATADASLIQRIERPGDWNQYEILATGSTVVLQVNGHRTAVWVEREPGIETAGAIALQIHGNCKAEISFRQLSIEELPASGIPPQDEILSRFGLGQPAGSKPAFADGKFAVLTNEVLVFVGQENLVREQKSGQLESRLAAGFASKRPRFRSMAWEADTVYEQWRDLNFGAWAPQLEKAGATMVVAQFGQLEALDGVGRLTEFTAAYHRLLDQFAARTRRLVLIGPMPFETPRAPHAPDLARRNGDVAAYSEAIRDLARQRGAVFVDLFATLSARGNTAPRLTDDGMHLTAEGLEQVAAAIARQLGADDSAHAGLAALRGAIIHKNRLWYDCWRPANWSFVYGDRISQVYGKGTGAEPSLREAFERYRPMIEVEDSRIHSFALGEGASDRLRPVQPIPTPGPKSMSPAEQLKAFTVANGYSVNLFASEADGVVKPTQFSWDERGRLYVACSPTYPQSKASDPPGDYILVLHDTDGDGRADKSWKFAEGLTMVQGVEPGAGGVYVCDFDQILHLQDTDGDGRADVRRVLLSGFGIGDTHQLVNSIVHGPDGSLWFTQGLHAFSRVETPWGVARLDRSAVWRLRPRELRMDGFFGGGMAGANCWGVAFDDFGQVFHKSGDRPHGYWTVPGIVRGANPLGSGSTASADVSYANSPEQYHSVGPLFETSPKTTALDIIGTQAMPDELQGCAVIGGYFGGLIEIHRFADLGSGFKTTQLPRILTSSTNVFRPVDVSVGPDGAIYAADWCNPVIGHYQVSYADPRRDKSHGRIWRITANGRSSIRQPDLASMQPRQLLDQLHSPERWTRQQARRLLFDAPSDETVQACDAWLLKLQPEVPNYERILLEVTGVYEAHGTSRPGLLTKLLSARDPRVRAYGARVVGAWAAQLPEPLKLLQEQVRDPHPRVRLEAVVAASYVPAAEAVEVVTGALESPLDPFLEYAMRQSAKALQPRWGALFAAGKLRMSGGEKGADYLRQLVGKPIPPPHPGQIVYEMACLPCHQPEGKGLPGVYPPLQGSDWVKGESQRLIKVVLHGLAGPITIAGQLFGSPDSVPMPPLAGLTDEQVADVLTYVRASYGSGAPSVSAAEVRQVRQQHLDRQQPWTESELH